MANSSLSSVPSYPRGHNASLLPQRPSIAPAAAPATLPKPPRTEAALMEAVASNHERLSRNAFFKALQDKALRPAQVACYLVDQDHVVCAIEGAMVRLRDDPQVAPMVHPSITNRSGLAAQDAAGLNLLCLPDASPAACRLATRIGNLSLWTHPDFCPAAVAVHAWVQYNAMLSGGQSVARGLRALYPDLQVSLFDFDKPARQLRSEYVGRINDINHANVSVAALCNEAQLALASHAGMLDAVMCEGRIARLFDNI